MKNLRKLSMAAVLMLMLGTYALAGITDTPPAPQASATATGIIGTSPSARPAGAPSNPVVDIALIVLQSVLSVF